MIIIGAAAEAERRYPIQTKNVQDVLDKNFGKISRKDPFLWKLRDAAKVDTDALEWLKARGLEPSSERNTTI